MSKKEQVALVGEYTVGLAESRKKLACWRAKADQVIERLNKVSAALRTESDSLYADLDDLPTRDEVEEVFSAIRRERNIVVNSSAKLKDMMPELPLADL